MTFAIWRISSSESRSISSIRTIAEIPACSIFSVSFSFSFSREGEAAPVVQTSFERLPEKGNSFRGAACQPEPRLHPPSDLVQLFFDRFETVLLGKAFAEAADFFPQQLTRLPHQCLMAGHEPRIERHHCERDEALLLYRFLQIMQDHSNRFGLSTSPRACETNHHPGCGLLLLVKEKIRDSFAKCLTIEFVGDSLSTLLTISFIGLRQRPFCRRSNDTRMSSQRTRHKAEGQTASQPSIDPLLPRLTVYSSNQAIKGSFVGLVDTHPDIAYFRRRLER